LFEMPTPEMQAKLDKMRELEQLSAQQAAEVNALSAEYARVVKEYGKGAEAAQQTAELYWKAADAYRQTRAEYERAAAPVVVGPGASNAWGVAILLMFGITAVALAKKRR
jgi:hypothetical protein